VEIGIKEGATRYSSPRLPPPSSPFLLGAMPLYWVCVGVRGSVIPVGELEGVAGSPDTRFCSSSTVRLKLTPRKDKQRANSEHKNLARGRRSKKLEEPRAHAQVLII
jgi:hypothetical protein